MKLRFVTGNDFVSRLILAREGPMASWVKAVPSHVEMVVKDGYLGAHDQGGVQIRAIGYDKSYLAAERFIEVSLPDEAGAEAYARAHIGEPYDFAAILDLAAPLPLDYHDHDHCICSALMTLTLKRGGGFPFSLALPAHLVSPALLLFWLSGNRPIPNAGAAA